MKRILVFTLVSLFIASCQSNNSFLSSSGSREIANTVVLRNFLDDVARQMSAKGQHVTTAQLEKKIMEYLRRKSDDMAHGNWTKFGLKKFEADNMKSLYDDVPYRTKLHNHIAENITTILKVSDDIAYNSYKLIMRETGSVINPYTISKNSSTTLMNSRRRLVTPPAFTKTPYQSINNKSSRVFTQISEVKDQAVKKMYMKNYMSLAKRGKADPRMMSNTNEIFESAAQINRVTRRPAIADGCNDFVQTAPDDVIDGFANFMSERNRIVQREMKELTKGGKNIDDLTTKQVDDIMAKAEVEAFEITHGYSRIEAQAAVRRLKNKPCKVL